MTGNPKTPSFKTVVDTENHFLSFTGFYVLSAGGIYALVAKGVIVSTYAIPYFGYFLIFWGMSKLPPIRRFLDVRLPQLLKVK